MADGEPQPRRERRWWTRAGELVTTTDDEFTARREAEAFDWDLGNNKIRSTLNQISLEAITT